ncbi:hypothetical protein TrispH2_003670 [Trichoplax sp. H2]|nr:hypothetical protein TrispH2_003670 [Trichoplax sp. H2]|eukprot:RDD43659.1 hypothetical protein TrispH2_003670 [Trichoplax sp. H2]
MSSFICMLAILVATLTICHAIEDRNDHKFCIALMEKLEHDKDIQRKCEAIKLLDILVKDKDSLGVLIHKTEANNKGEKTNLNRNKTIFDKLQKIGRRLYHQVKERDDEPELIFG